MILVDTNVLLDVLQDDPTWADWSQSQLETSRLTSALVINAVIYSEVSVSFRNMEELEMGLSAHRLAFRAIPREALFLAGKAYLSYRRQGDTKQSVLPDFYVGAHAAVEDCALITRDASRYRTYFPSVRLITPD